jgi:hypothetical protein
MRIALGPLTVWLTVGALLLSSPAWARQHIADPATLQQAIAAKDAADSVNRAAVERVLARPDVQTVAARMGLDVTQARTALAGVSGEELAALAITAQAAEADFAGGNQTVTISVTTLLLVIIIIILIAD